MVTVIDTNMQLAASLIKSFEGLRLMSYICAAGKRTIGYGHVMQAYERIPEQISADIAEELLEKDIQKAQSTIYRLCKVSITPEQCAALISFVFNCGGGAFQALTSRPKLNRGEYVLAANEFPRWLYSRNKIKGFSAAENCRTTIVFSRNLRV